MVKKSIFFINLLFFALSISGFIVAFGVLVSGNKVEIATAQIPKELFDIIVNVLVLIGLYGYAFNKIIMNKVIWLIVLIVAAIKTVLLDIDFSQAVDSQSLVVFSIVVGWQLVILTTLVFYIRYINSHSK